MQFNTGDFLIVDGIRSDPRAAKVAADASMVDQQSLCSKQVKVIPKQLSLQHTVRIQGDVGVTLKPLLLVPVGFTMAHQDEARPCRFFADNCTKIKSLAVQFRCTLAKRRLPT